MGYNMNGFSGFGNSPMKKEDERAGKSDLESKFSQTGDDPKDYPQYSVQDYSKVRKDEKGNYVVRLQD